METFWPNTDQDSARNSLNVAIHNVRGILHEVNPDYEYILFKEECYFLNPGIDVWVDVEEFLHYWKIAQRTERQNGIQAAVGEYEAAAALYHGDFLEEDLYESWPSSERENLKEIYLFVLDRLSNYYSQDGKPSTAASLCETILAKDNCREDIHQRLMRCYCRLEQREKAVKQYRKCVEALEAELDVKPTRATIELYERIKHGILTREDNEIL
jgi:DNA-binding SARP family transcriptional activator